MTSRIVVGDCREVMAAMEANAVDAVVTDPPYNLTNRVPDCWKCEECGRVLGGRDRDHTTCPRCGGSLFRQRTNGGGFMGAKWDATGVAFDPATWAAVLRVLKPGGVLMAFGGTRTWHRLACAVEDAGFQIFDTLMWLYGQGFPKHKSLLKPGFEPIVLAKKPGAGGLHVEAGRIGTELIAAHGGGKNGAGRIYASGKGIPALEAGANPHIGRWPANVALDESAALLLDEMSGERQGGAAVLARRSGIGFHGHGSGTEAAQRVNYGDTGGASRFFKVCAPDGEETRFFYAPKASRKERDMGLDELPLRPAGAMEGTHDGSLLTGSGNPRNNLYRNSHPTVKNLSLMRWLVRLACPPGGLILDPFAGSGTTGVAATLEGFDSLLIEQSPEYAEIAEKRVAAVTPEAAQLSLV